MEQKSVSEILQEKYTKTVGAKKSNPKSMYGEAYSFLLLGAFDLDFGEKLRNALIQAKNGISTRISGIVSEDYSHSLLRMSTNVKNPFVLIRSPNVVNFAKYHIFPSRNIVNITVKIENNENVFEQCINGKHQQ